MTDRRFDCDHRPEGHVLYDREASGYRAQLRCICRKVMRTSRKLHAGFDEAAVEALRMQAAKPSRPRPSRKMLPAPVETPCHVKVPDISLDQAWIMWWREIAARHGHESRL